MKKSLVVTAALIVVGSAATFMVAATSGQDGTPATARSAAQAPQSWPVPADQRERAEAAGLDMGPMGTAEHYHPQLAITVNGRPLQIPSDIGVDPATGAMSAVHTHTPDGEIHVEADTIGEVFTLGQLFTQWGVTLGPSQLGELEGVPQVAVNGTPVSVDPRNLQLAPDQAIQLDFTASRE
jgi:hypothetical protein